MEVCHLLNTAGTGGAETFALELARGTTAPDIAYTFCYLGKSHTLAPEFDAVGAHVVCLDSHTNTPQFDPTVVPKLIRTIQQGDFDIIHAHMPYVQVLARLAGKIVADCKIVSTQHTPREALPDVSRIAFSLTQSLDTATIAVSSGVQESFTKASTGRQPWQATDHWHTIHNGIDVKGFNEKVQQATPSTDVGPSDPIFLNVGRYVPEKGQKYLIEAMDTVIEELPHAEAVLVGYGPMEEELRARVAARGLEDAVTITGKTTAVEEYYAIADVFVLPSIVEGLPIVGLEAMASELPVLGTRVPGVEDIVDTDVTGKVVPSRDSGALAEAMIDIGASSDSRQMGKRGYERARDQFDIAHSVQQYLELYRSILRENRP